MSQNNQQNDWEKKELGVLWSRKKNGTNEKFLTGKINLKNYGFDKDIDVVVFSNKKKTKDTHPDLRIYFSEPRGGSTQAAAPAATAASAPAKGRSKAAPAPAAVDDEELI